MYNLPGMKRYFNAEGAAAAAPTTFENKQTAPTEDITSVLHFDPFAKGEEIPERKEVKDPAPSGKTAKEAKPEGDESNLPAKGKEEKPDPTPKKPATEAKSEDSADYWKGIAEERGRKLDTAAPVKTEEEAGFKIPAYNFEIPDKLIEALTSQDAPTFKKGVMALAQGVAGAVHAQMAAHMDESYKPRFEGIPQQIFAVLQAREQAEAVSKDFYGTYPEFNRPALKSVIQKMGQDLAKKMKKTAWDEELRDALGAECREVFGVKAAAKITPPAKMLPAQGARAAATAVDSEEKDIADTIFGNF